VKFNNIFSVARLNMKTVSLLEFRKNADKIIRWSRQGKRMVMTYRGRPVMRLEPVVDESISDDDPFLRLDGIIEGKRESLDNKEMDGIIYGA
jgi:hypothetical protein